MGVYPDHEQSGSNDPREESKNNGQKPRGKFLLLMGGGFLTQKHGFPD